MRFDGVQSAGPKFDYSDGVIKRKEQEEDDPIRKAASTISHFAKNLGNFLAQGITNPQAADQSNTSTAFRQ